MTEDTVTLKFFSDASEKPALTIPDVCEYELEDGWVSCALAGKWGDGTPHECMINASQFVFYTAEGKHDEEQTGGG